MIAFVLWLAVVVVGVMLLVLAAELLLALLPASLTTPREGERAHPVAVLIPAHNEELGIAATLASIRAQLKHGDLLVVVADNCVDKTAEIAAASGATVVVRQDAERRGKGYALDAGVVHLRQLGYRGTVVIVDADCRLGDRAIDILEHECRVQAAPVQAKYLMRSAPGDPGVKRVSEFAWMVKNHVRPLGLRALGLPCPLFGSGMAFPWDVIETARLANGSIVEDMKLGLELIAEGRPALYAPLAEVFSEFSSTSKGHSDQRKRWEHGHLDLIVRTFPSLLARGLAKADRRIIGAAFDLLVPPMSLLFMLVACVLVASAIYGWLAGDFGPFSAIASSFVLVLLAVAADWRRFGRTVVSLGDLALVPVYVVRKLSLYADFLIRRQRGWNRADRG